MPVSRPDAPVFTDIHVYYHGAGANTKYSGSFDVGFLQGADQSHRFDANVVLKKTEDIGNQSVTGIVTDTPGVYTLTFALNATWDSAQGAHVIRDLVDVRLK